ncbi:MAG: metallophosphoesterase [Fibrobacterales bacterium]
MSDTQKSTRTPFTYSSIVYNDIIPSFGGGDGSHLNDSIAFILLAGDVVDDGDEHAQWRTGFFEQSAALLGAVPVYPTIGNHENDAEFYYDYFDLPQNGGPGFEERWWSRVHQNALLVGLNTNRAYRIQAQLDWYEEELKTFCADESL